MPHWLIKSGMQHGISWLPASEFWYELVQRHLTRSALLSESGFETRVQEAARYLELFRNHQPAAPQDFTALEVGTGWYPTFPLAFYLCGATEIWTFDIAGYVRRERLALVLDFFCAAAERGTLKQLLPAVRPDRIARLRELRASARQESPAQCLARLNIHLKVQDASETGLPAHSVDFIFSIGVLEYVPRSVLPRLLAEFRRVASARSLMAHGLDLADEFAKFDSNITDFNFLRFSERQWRWRNSPITPNNRLRVPDYRELIERAGFLIQAEENRLGSPEELRQIPLAQEFRHYAPADLLVLYSLITALPAGAQTR